MSLKISSYKERCVYLGGARVQAMVYDGTLLQIMVLLELAGRPCCVDDQCSRSTDCARGSWRRIRRFMQDAADSATSTSLAVHYSFSVTPSSLPKINGLISYLHAGRFIGNTIVN